ncbi:MAG: thioredoxin domain-containing protein [Propionibacteriaceae bacterium]|jgi:protein-disulfide isomerase|nr:thioredoxin domain-containing protein [Propionibacteriaceae bacterium]
MFCSQCGAQAAPGAKFCSNCGAALDASATAGQPGPGFVAPAAAKPASDNPYAAAPKATAGGRRGVYIAIIAVLAVALAAIGWVAFSPKGGTTGSAGTGEIPVAVNGYGITMGQPDAKVTVTVYLDYMCPWCGKFEQINGGDLKTLMKDGTAKVELHPISILDQLSAGSNYSTRAANAAITVAKGAPGSFVAFNDLLFANQPSENTTGLSDDQLVEYAKQAGVPDDVSGGFASLANADWVTGAWTAAQSAGVTGTPTILINGSQFSGNFTQAGEVAKAVKAAA